ncbi:hypothetical protein [Halopiger djelfimassiliensis]|uniref:hypothetical protein n=1 Tax=Halopiger djelfimassiliensis TaxID=1293047 RepID=UPI00067825CB|nr:hypothetical protein [Halopiger djelfimassiliensis]
MSIGGPRLDRPSAIGDDGRPRATSLWIATLAVVALVGVAGITIGEPSLLTGLGAVVGLAVAGAALLDRPRFVELCVGHAFLVTFGSALALIVLVPPFYGRIGVAISGFTLALFGIALAWADIGREGVKRAVVGSGLTYLSLLFSAVIGAVLVGFAILAWGFLRLVADASTPVASVVGFLTVLGATGCILLVSLRWLPIRQLTPRDRRERVEQRLAVVRRWLVRTVLGAVALLAGTAGLWIGGWHGTALARTPGLATALQGLSSPVVVWTLAGIGTAALGGGLIAVGLRWCTRRFGTAARRQTAAVVVGTGFALAAAVALVLVVSGIIVGNLVPVYMVGTTAPIAAVLLLLGPIAFVILLGAVLVGVAIGVVPDRAGGPAIAAAGLVTAAIGIGWSHHVLVFACLAGAALVWDVSTFGLGLTGELGHLPDTRRLELVHGVCSIGLAIGAVLVATALETLRTGVFAGFGGPGATLAVALGAVLLLVPLRG